MTSDALREQISAIVPTFDGMHLLRGCVCRLACVASSLSIAVVDDASTDGTLDMLRSDFPCVRVVARTTNGGFSAAVNDGIRATDSEFVVLLNNDVEVTPGFLDPILPMFEDESVFAVSPSILLPKRGNIDEGCKTGFWHHGMFYADQQQGVTDVRPTLYACGCAAVYRRSMLEQLGGFDEAYSPFYWEDVDLGYRAWKRGWKSLYQPASMVYHQHAATVSRLDKRFTESIKLRNAYQFVWRNIDSPRLVASHRRWLPYILMKSMLVGRRDFVTGWWKAIPHRDECLAVRRQDSIHRVMSDEEILTICGNDTSRSPSSSPKELKL